MESVNDEWQQGLCDTYAMAMLKLHPHMRMGIAGYKNENGWEPQHYFAHDDTHAYDSRGKHPLPYHGINGQFDHVELNQDPADWVSEHGDNGSPEDLERALKQIQTKDTHADKLSVVANILDPIHDTLSPYVFDDPGSEEPKLKDVHRKWIVDRIHALAEKFHPNSETWLHLVLTGSLTTYQYSDESDVDTSLFVDHNVLPDWDRAKLIGLMVSHLDGVKLPGTPYPMQCFVVPPEVTMDDLYQEGLRSGYSLDEQRWIIPPDRKRVHNVEQEYNAYYVYALESADKMERLLKYDPDKAIMFWHQIHKRRQRDQRAGKGDFSEANIVYKFLANRGLFPKISEVSGEYIAKTAAHPKPRVIYQEMKDYNRHPGPPDSPFIYDPKTNMVFFGPPGAYHWDLIKKIPELRGSYPPEEDYTKAPTSVSQDHIHGRADMRQNTGLFYNGDDETRAAIADAMGFQQPKPVVDDDDNWT